MRSASFTRYSALAAVCAVFAPATARAHAFVEQPPSRDTAIANLDDRAHKFGPCGGSARTGMPTQYAVGATVQVKFTETIGHRGCFQIAFSPANDEDWVTLKQVDDPAGPLPGEPDKSYTETVKLPDGVSCKECTLVVRQLMIDKACGPDAVPGAKDTYYSCADIRVGDFADAGPSRPPSAGEDGDSGTSSGGVSTTPTEGGGKTNGNSTAGRKLTSVDSSDGGCNLAVGGAASGFTLAASAALGALTFLRRRRRQ